MKIFISQPMKDRSKEEIKAERTQIINDLRNDFSDETVEILDSYFENYDGKKPLNWLAESLGILAQADLVVFAKGWEDARGCCIEHKCAVDYGYKIRNLEASQRRKKEILKINSIEHINVDEVKEDVSLESSYNFDTDAESIAQIAHGIAVFALALDDQLEPGTSKQFLTLVEMYLGMELDGDIALSSEKIEA